MVSPQGDGDWGECWIGGKLGQPIWDTTDYTRDFVWLGLDRSMFALPYLTDCDPGDEDDGARAEIAAPIPKTQNTHSYE